MQFQNDMTEMDNLTSGTQRLIHLDLKGAPPRIHFFEKLFPFLKNIGATGILLEWEDTFPYTKELTQIGGLSDSAQATGSPYSLEEARQLLDLAKDSELSVIPLVQTFGHMEFVLKHEQYRGLREAEPYPSSMCPSKSDTLQLVRSMVRQMIAFHPHIQYIHIGGDEIWHMGLCSACQKRIQTSKFGRAGLYLDHMTEVAQFIKDNYPNLKIIVWDDMFRNIDLNILQEYYIGNLVEPMIWHYNSSDTFRLGGNLWEKYSNIFANVWAASAFKGATSSCQLLPVTKYHVSNHEAWLSELGMHAGKIVNFRGIALTGWSRFDHYATLCELLPCGVPSLCFCMKTWISGGYSPNLNDSVAELLGYNDNLFNSDCVVPRPPLPLPQLSFPGWQIFVGFEWLVHLRTKFKNIIDSDQVQTWLNVWQIANDYTNPMQIDSILPVVNEVIKELIPLKDYLQEHLDQVFFKHTVDELIGTLVIPVERKLNQLKADCETQLSLGCRVRGHKRLNI
ncbi:unnamed protein product [Phaedon cochleariae]|uniref:beta-N-acetylhexosaminidase n=1 Tax=Phaedon cochleariae TaxID=80249 RepID=A0A9P0DPU0_PHACE|nr:unnamed protein product [Phaedon cochleariae]